MARWAVASLVFGMAAVVWAATWSIREAVYPDEPRDEG